MKYADVTFMCGGAAGCVVVGDEHTAAGSDHAKLMARQQYDETRRGCTMEESIAWMQEGEEASRRRLEIREYRAIQEATALLKRHGYRVTPRRPSRPATPEGA